MGDVLGVRVDATDASHAIETIIQWGAEREQRSIFFCNAHMVVTSHDDAQLDAALKDADFVAPDGYPVAWSLRQQGYPEQSRVTGPDLMLGLIERAALEGQSIYLYGDTEETLERLQSFLMTRFPTLEIAGAHSPPFRPRTDVDDQMDVSRINGTRPNLVFVALGCPRQEKWIHQNKSRVWAPMLGVGAAFGFLSGSTPRAPAWMRSNGLEWAHRLAGNPRRLAKRYLVTNTLFLWRTIVPIRHRSRGASDELPRAQ